MAQRLGGVCNQSRPLSFRRLVDEVVRGEHRAGQCDALAVETEVHAASMACRTTVGSPQVKIVCQQIRGHSVHNFAVAKSLTRSLSWAAWHSKKRAHTASQSARTRPERVTRRHRLGLQTIENCIRLSERIGQFMN